ncbi:MAG: transcription termination factor NusA [Microgenomates group bacterium]|jgi:N utilization substance protein A|nr:transcription termination factor NusA [Candidatus Woesebacteria bacterium]MBP6882802.1 transcription termination factor NusA [Candidatus Woesebacteria bacterium]QQR63621.1 MAG: transcription termination factor NusA [Candidatus Roizmanbacteria bacterium]
MSIIKSEFALALNQVATERGISADEVVQSIETAILAAYKKEMHEAPLLEGENDGISVKVNRDTGEAHLYKEEKDITPSGFGRIAAQTAKQVILQKIREVEKKTVVSHYRGQVGTLVKGRVIRYDGYNAFVDIGRVEAVLPKEDQIRNETYNVNNQLIFLLKEIGEDKFGNSRIIVSRTAPQLISELFKKEVPEIANNTVEIKNVVREPGERAKIAVYSSQGGVDPVGACVGQKGVRVQTVTNELGGAEKIDIIQWNSDESVYLASALSPAQIQKIEIVDKKARVTVEESQAPLAIGKGGVNVNLASKLTGFEIDIEQIKSDKPAEATPIEAETKSVEAAQVEPETTQSVTEDIVATTEAPAEKVVEETPAETTPETPVEATTDTQTTSDAK